jgi:molybdate transport system substrate-binding protein
MGAAALPRLRLSLYPDRYSAVILIADELPVPESANYRRTHANAAVSATSTVTAKVAATVTAAVATTFAAALLSPRAAGQETGGDGPDWSFGGEHRALAALAAFAALVTLAGGPAARADEVLVAVAANFLAPIEEIATAFEAESGHSVSISAGSTGQLYAQIVNGAPFDVLLSADAERPALLAEAGLGEPQSVFTYAIGQLALWSRDPERVDATTLERLGEIEFRWLAIAEPDVAPYGAAAQQTLESLGLWSALQPRLVRGQSIAQTFAMAATGNAEIGFVALSQALTYEGEASYAIVPRERFAPIRQDAILVRRAAANPAARGLLEFLRGPVAGAIIERYGYSPGTSAN